MDSDSGECEEEAKGTREEVEVELEADAEERGDALESEDQKYRTVETKRGLRAISMNLCYIHPVGLDGLIPFTALR